MSNEPWVWGVSRRGRVLIRREGRTAVGFDPTADNDRQPHGLHLAQEGVARWAVFPGSGPSCCLGRGVLRARAGCPPAGPLWQAAWSERVHSVLAIGLKAENNTVNLLL